MKKLSKILAIIGGIVAVLAAAGAVVCLLKKKGGCKESRKYVSCPSEEDASEETEESDIDIPEEDAE